MFDNLGQELDSWFFEELFKFIKRGVETIEVRTIDGSWSPGAVDTFEVIRPCPVGELA